MTDEIRNLVIWFSFAVGVLGFFLSIIFYPISAKHVSREKLMAVEDLSKLFHGIPDKQVLSDQGLKYYRIASWGTKLFFVMGILAALVAAVWGPAS